MCAESEVCLCVVEAVVVEVVTNEAFWGIGNLSVHADVFAGIFSEGIVSGTLFGGTPFVAGKYLVILWVDDCEFALR